MVGFAGLPAGRRRQPLPQAGAALLEIPPGQQGAVVVRQGLVDRADVRRACSRSHRPRLCSRRAHASAGLARPIPIPAAVIAAIAFAVPEPVLLHRLQPGLPTAVQGLPVGGLQVAHRPL